MRPPSLKASDFHRALGTRPLARTAHFALHVLPRATVAKVASKADTELDLSTPADAALNPVVDGCGDVVDASGQLAWRLGLVLPKKQAKRSVTRSLIRHQAREALRRYAPLVRGQGRHGDEVDGWVVRLKAPFDRQLFPSAASAALASAVRAELDALWTHLLVARTQPPRGGA